MKLGHNGMLHVGPSFVMYALLLDLLSCCPRAHFELDAQFESETKKINRKEKQDRTCSAGS